jgi:signal transduction histidine kinase
MNLGETLEKFREQWIEKVLYQLASGDRIRSTFREQVNTFYDLLKESIETLDPNVLDSLLLQWVNARTETELESRENSILPILSQIMQITYEICDDQLEVQESSHLGRIMLPTFTHSMEYVAAHETQIHVQHITSELGKTRSVLERLEKSKSDFISVAAHELKTPLTLIEGYISMFKDALPESETKRAVAELYLKGVHAGTRRLREIVDDMIDVSMIDNNLLALNFQPLWLNHILEAIQRELMETIQQRNLKLEIHQFAGSNEAFYGDGERLYQAFRNIITNAVKYTPDGGNIDIDGRLLPGFVEVTIADTGIGIDPEFHMTIFEKFGRLGSVSLHSSGKTKFKGGGPGLGLPITKGIIDAHGGAIWVESEGSDEKTCPGSIFHIMLPLRKSPPDDKTSKLFKNLILDQ